jgi:Na+-translocating ferredoxin:NAD+ oxidoreductase RnfG subunit
MKISKMTTAQIQQGIRADVIDLTAQAKLSATDSFLPLAQYSEFSDLMEKRQIREATQTKSTSMKEMFEKLDRQDRRRKRWGFLKRWAEGVGGLISLIVYLAAIAAVLGGGGWAFFEFGLPWIKGLMQ